MPCAWPKWPSIPYDGLLGDSDHGGIILKVNDSFSRITGFGTMRCSVSISRPCGSTHYGDSLKEEVTAVDEQGTGQGEEQCLHRDGHLFPVRLMVSGAGDEEDEISHSCPASTTSPRRRRRPGHIERFAYYDDPADLYNRRSLNDIMQRTLRSRNGQQAIAAAGSDNFKSINDFGHACGDLAAPGRGGGGSSPRPRRIWVLACTSGTSLPGCSPRAGQGWRVTAKIIWSTSPAS